MTFTAHLKSSVSTLLRGAIGVAGGVALFAAIAGVPADALAQTAAPAAPAPAPAPIQGEGPALWVVKDADSTLYLFGSVHVLRPTTGWASPASRPPSTARRTSGSRSAIRMTRPPSCR